MKITVIHRLRELEEFPFSYYGCILSISVLQSSILFPLSNPLLSPLSPFLPNRDTTLTCAYVYVRYVCLSVCRSTFDMRRFREATAFCGPKQNPELWYPHPSILSPTSTHPRLNSPLSALTLKRFILSFHSFSCVFVASLSFPQVTTVRD